VREIQRPLLIRRRPRVATLSPLAGSHVCKLWTGEGRDTAASITDSPERKALPYARHARRT
jgi:hypothetical protein